MAELDMGKLGRTLKESKVSVADANDLVPLNGYEIIIVADDSEGPESPRGSDRTAPQPDRGNVSRWDELKKTVEFFVDLGGCVSPDGLDVYFVNRGTIRGIQGKTNEEFVKAFGPEPSGTMPLGERVGDVIKEKDKCSCDKPVLLLILVDGEPDKGSDRLKKQLQDLVSGRLTRRQFQVQVMVMSRSKHLQYLFKICKETPGMKIVDDYHADRFHFRRIFPSVEYTREDWAVRAMLMALGDSSQYAARRRLLVAGHASAASAAASDSAAGGSAPDPPRPGGRAHDIAAAYSQGKGEGYQAGRQAAAGVEYLRGVQVGYQQGLQQGYRQGYAQCSAQFGKGYYA